MGITNVTLKQGLVMQSNDNSMEASTPPRYVLSSKCTAFLGFYLYINNETRCESALVSDTTTPLCFGMQAYDTVQVGGG